MDPKYISVLLTDQIPHRLPNKPRIKNVIKGAYIRNRTAYKEHYLKLN